ncbi:DUF3138 family protein [Methylibium sp.]|uniref:DUF3138 family protein n=1 Tax=Methylibium sp. TaxID=2067992 RepID=UPI003D0EBAAB
MKNWHTTALALALAAAFPAARAQSNADLLKEFQALKDRVTELESKLKAAEAKQAAPAAAQWGMTPEQAQEFNRVAVKTEALEDNIEAAGLKGLKISGYVDPTYIYNQRQNRAGFQFLNKVEDDGYNYDNSYFGAVSIDFLKETDSGTRWHLTLTPNRGVGAVFDGNSIVQEASVSVPLTDLQTRLIAGQVPDWSGYEYQQPTLNKLITHNLLYDFTLPTAYTGAGVEITRGKWIVKAMLAQVNATKNPQGEKGSALVYRADYSKGEYQGFGFAGVHGKLANFRSDDVNPITTDPYDTGNTAVNLFEVDGYFIRGDWTLQGQLSYGQQTRAAVTADPTTGELRDARWYGVSALAAYKLTPRLEGIVRGDYIKNDKNGGGLLGFAFSDDRNGIGPGFAFDGGSGTWVQPDGEKGVNRAAISFGMGYALNGNTVLKAEYRIDHANAPVFLDVRTGEYRKTNQLLGAAVVVSF